LHALIVRLPLMFGCAGRTNAVFDIPDQFNVAAYFIDHHIGEGRAAKIATECDERKISYLELFHSVNRAGNAFRAAGLQI
jgi:acyl-coenzyme A synthetase/AMP-(fatty) acid ligase